GLMVRRLAPEHAYRHDLRVVHGLLAEGGDYAIQGRRDAALVVAAEPVRLRRQVEEGGGLDMLPDSHRQYRARQAGLGAFAVDHRQVAHRGLLQYVEHRLAAVELEGEGGLIDGFRAYPEVQQAAQCAEGHAAERGAGHTDS